MNFVFISPNFPTNYWHFCRELAANGVHVLGIGDCPYDQLDEPLRESLTEYYRVNTLENYDEVYRAVAFLTFRHGRIDWLESNNEYWLEQDARLRTDFNIGTGFKLADMGRIKYKSSMKTYYRQAGLPTARYHLVDTLENCRAFVQEVGYPVIVKPDNGVGANDTHKIHNDQELERFLWKQRPVVYIMEEFVHGEVCTYDAIINSKGVPLFESGNVSPMSIMDIVNDEDNSVFYMVKELADDVRRAGRKCVETFGVRSRFIHLEFFRLTEDQDGLGQKGDLIGLEVNMRPSGGYSTEMHNFANSTNVYKIWADMVVFDRCTLPVDVPHYYCVHVGRRDGKTFAYSRNQIRDRYKNNIVLECPIPEALSGAMGDYLFMGKFSEKEQMEQFVADVVKPGN